MTCLCRPDNICVSVRQCHANFALLRLCRNRSMDASEPVVSTISSAPAAWDPLKDLIPTSIAKAQDTEYWSNYERTWCAHLNRTFKEVHTLNFDAENGTLSNINCRLTAKRALDILTRSSTSPAMIELIADKQCTNNTGTELYFLTRSGRPGWAAMLANRDGFAMPLFDEDAQTNWKLSDFVECIDDRDDVQQALLAQIHDRNSLSQDTEYSRDRMCFAAIPFYGKSASALSAGRQGDFVSNSVGHYKVPEDSNEENIFLVKVLYNAEDTESHLMVLLTKGTFCTRSKTFIGHVMFVRNSTVQSDDLDRLTALDSIVR